jgi:glycerophosphoryl diester phosphodiesterase
MMSEFKMLWLLDLDYSWPWWLLCVNKMQIIRKLKKFKLDGVDVWAGKILNDKFISEFKKAGFSVCAWTVNSPDKVKSLFKQDIDGITTDRAAWMKDQLKK